MRIETISMDGSYDELADAAEDIDEILEAKASDLLDLTPVLERWLVDVLEQIEVALE